MSLGTIWRGQGSRQKEEQVQRPEAVTDGVSGSDTWAPARWQYCLSDSSSVTAL